MHSSDNLILAKNLDPIDTAAATENIPKESQSYMGHRCAGPHAHCWGASPKLPPPPPTPAKLPTCRHLGLGRGLPLRSPPQNQPESEGWPDPKRPRPGGALSWAHRPRASGGARFRGRYSADEHRGATMKKMELPPMTIKEFLEAQNLEEWPKSTHLKYDAYTSSLAVKRLKDACSYDAIFTYLNDNVTTKHKALLEMEFRMKDLFDDFQAHASLFIDYTKSTAMEDHYRKLEKLRKMINQKRKKTIFMYPYATTGEKTVENCNFLGFRVNMKSKLPRHLTASEIFLYVLKAQKLDVKSFRIWLCLLLTESSITLLQDAFWWWFLHKFKPNQHDEDLLFDRISESYVLLIMKVPSYRKDTFFKLYPDWLSQAIYTIFLEAFPDSSRLFDDAFKEELVTTMYDWMIGLGPKERVWTLWDLGALEEYTIHGNKRAMLREPKGRLREITSKDMEFNLDKLIQETQNTLLLTPDQETTRNLIHKKSHNIGPGPEFCRYLFRVAGQSPLVAYYLKMHEIATNPRLPWSCKIHMTQIFRWPTNIGPTYREVAAESRKIFARNKAAYNVESKLIKDQIRAIKNKQRECRKKFLSLEHKARTRPEEAMNDCMKYLEELRDAERSRKTISTRSPSAVAAAAIASIPAFASLLACEATYSEDEEHES
ncbi:protein FAM227B [Notamacropus eugenii]|uniref:protein FAM227B n=1 Tax=Notamacropus eugenii TaxID=9315 RepID=UPI003B674D3D